jgi:hypothetical protein
MPCHTSVCFWRYAAYSLRCFLVAPGKSSGFVPENLSCANNSCMTSGSSSSSGSGSENISYLCFAIWIPSFSTYMIPLKAGAFLELRSPISIL